MKLEEMEKLGEKIMDEYTYFISYQKSNGYGNTFVTLSTPLDSPDLLRTIEDQFQKQYGNDTIRIMNFQLYVSEVE